MVISKILTKDFVLAFLAQFALSVASFAFIPTLPIYLAQLGSTETEIGLLIGVYSVASLIVRPLVGRSLLKTPERGYLMAGALLFTLSSIAYFFSPPFWPFLAVRVFQGIGLALFYTASTTLIANISPEAHRGQSLSYFLLTFNLAFVLAPSLGMFLINQFSFPVLFFFCSGVSFCALLLTIRIRRRDPEPVEDLSPGSRSLLNREVLQPSVMAFFAHMIWGALTAFFPLYAVEQGVANPGLFFAVFAIMLVLGRTLGARILDRFGREEILFPCLIVYVVSMLILAFSKTLPMFALVAVIWGAGNAFLYPTLVLLTLDLAGPSRGPAMGTFTAICDLGVGLGAVMMGFVLRLTNYPVMFLCLAFLALINFLYFNFFVRKRKRPT